MVRVVLVGGLLTGCAGSPTIATPTMAPTTPTPVATTAAPSPSPTPAWVVGASPLPLAADGYGRRLPTPRVLRDRHLPTTDLLPPPTDGRFHATVTAITPAIRKRMGDAGHRRLVARFTQEKMHSGYAKLYDELLHA